MARAYAIVGIELKSHRGDFTEIFRDHELRHFTGELFLIEIVAAVPKHCQRSLGDGYPNVTVPPGG
jgi:hypothetical protein